MEEKLLEALKLAGKLAVAAEEVTNSDIYTISNYTWKLKQALLEYNQYIMELIDENPY